MLIPGEKKRPCVLVAGGAGYIGSHACKALYWGGYQPVCYDNLVYGHEWAVKWGPLEEGDLEDRKRLDEVFEKYRPAAVMHFAAYAYVGESVENPGKYYRNNVAGSLSLLETMRDHGVGKIVFSSTCATYGIPDHVPISETYPQRPINPYGFTKLCVERMLNDFEVAHGISHVILRYFNAAGADPEGELGEAHNPETHLIPLVLEAASGCRESVTVFGTDYETPDGTCIRDYIHVSDLANAHVAALNALLSGGKSMVFNLGTGKGRSVAEVLSTAEDVTGRTIPVIYGDRRHGDPPVLVADATFARTCLKWEPVLSDIKTIVETAWAWHMLRTKEQP